MGWNTIGSKVGKTIQRFIESKEGSKPELTDEERRQIEEEIIQEQREGGFKGTAKQALRKWHNTTWGELVGGIVKDTVDAASIELVKRGGQQAVDEIGNAIKGAQDGGIQGTAEALQDTHNRAYEAIAQSLLSAKESFNWGIKKGYDAIYGPELPLDQVPPPL